MSASNKILHLWDSATGAEINILVGHKSDVTGCDFSPDGARIVTASTDGDLRLWDATTGAEICKLIGHEDKVMTCAFSPDGSRIVSGSDDATLRLWDGLAGTPIATMRGHELVVPNCDFSPDGARIVSYGRFDETLRVWDGVTGAEVAWSGPHQSAVGACIFSPDGTRILSYSGEEMALWNSAENQRWVAGEKWSRIWQLKTFGHHSSNYRALVRDCAFSPDGKLIVSASQDRTLNIWDGLSGRLLRTLTGHEGIVTSCDFSPDNRGIVSASVDGTLRLWDAETGSVLAILAEHGGAVEHCEFSRDGTRILSAGGGRLKLWDVESACEQKVRSGHLGDVFACDFSPEGSRILSASTERRLLGLTTSSSDLKLWQAQTGEEVASITPLTSAYITGHVCQLTCCAFFPDGQRLVAGCFYVAERDDLELDGERSWPSEDEQGLRIWDATTACELGRIEMSSVPNDVKVSRCGKRIVTASRDGMIHVFDAASLVELIKFGGPWKGGDRIALLPTGDRVMSAFHLKSDVEETIRLWDAATGEELAAFEGDPYHSVMNFSLSRDGNFLAIVSSSGAITVWAVTDRKKVASKRGSACAFSPDGQALVCCSADGGLEVWEIQTGTCLASLETHSDPVRWCDYSFDGRHVVFISADRTLAVWSIERRREVARYVTDGITAASLSPLHNTIAWGGRGGTLFLLSLEEPTQDPHR